MSDLRSEGGPSTPETGEKLKSLEISRAHLDQSLAYRIRLDNPNQQASLINELRAIDGQADSPWMVALPDGQDFVIGFMRNPDELNLFKDVASRYPGRFGLGASREDSQIAIATKSIHENEVVTAYNLTGSDTNGAARVVMYEPDSQTENNHLLFRTEKIGAENMVAFRYLDEEQKNEVSADSQVLGAKGQPLERIEVNEDYFSSESSHRPLSELFDSKGSELAGHLRSPYSAKREVLEDFQAASMSVDVNSFSKKIHEFGSGIQKAKTEEEKQTLRKERDSYLDSIMKFFDTVERGTVSAMQESSDEKVREQAKTAKLLDWRGDAGGILVPKDASEMLYESISNAISLPEFSDLTVKVSVSLHESSEIVTPNSGRTFVPEAVEAVDSAMNNYLKQAQAESEDKDLFSKDNSVLVTVGDEGQIMNIAVYEKGVPVFFDTLDRRRTRE